MAMRPTLTRLKVGLEWEKDHLADLDGLFHVKIEDAFSFQIEL